MRSMEKLLKADQIAERLNVQTITTLESERVLGRPLEGHAPNQRTSSRYGVCPRTDEILTVPDVARELHCSKAHVYNVINGKVEGVSQLPAICMGRRKLIRRSSLESWKKASEKGSLNDGTIPSSPEVDAVRRSKGGFHA